MLSAVLALPGSIAVAMSPDGSLAAAIVPKADGTNPQLLLPYFEVDTNNPGGRTTLMAIVNHDAVSRSVTIHYFDARTVEFKVTDHTLDPNATLTVNLRDVSGMPVDDDGMSRGTVLVTGDSAARLSGDFFLVDPSQNFAQGDRLVNFTPAIYCRLWQFRVAMGGAFSGGTWLTVVMPTKRPDAPSPHFYAQLLDEAGTSYGAVPITMHDNVLRFAAIKIIEVLVQPLPDSFFGSIRIHVDDSIDGALVLGEWNADGRFQVGFNGTCLD